MGVPHHRAGGVATSCAAGRPRLIRSTWLSAGRCVVAARSTGVRGDRGPSLSDEGRARKWGVAVTDYGPYEVHPLATAFPLIEGGEFALLVKDISENGLARPILLSADESMIIDGRNRYRACEAAQVDPNFTS